jgi:hypothetical protein
LAKKRINQQSLKRDPLMEQYLKTTNFVKERSRPITKWLSLTAIAIVLAGGFWWFTSYRSTSAAGAMAEAFRYHDAQVSNPIPPGITGYAFTTQDEKHRKAYAAFEKAARDYPSYNGEIARYFAATHQLYFEPEKAEVTLKELSQKDSEIGARARLALAQRYESTGKFDDALAEYKKLKVKPFLVPSAVIDINMAKVYEALGKTNEAIDLYFTVANNKDWRTTDLGKLAIERLTILSPEKADQLAPTEPSSPFGGPGGI